MDLRFHDLRHDFATVLINNGAALYQVQLALGRKDHRMSARYAHLLPENRDVVNLVDGKGTATILLQSEERKRGSLGNPLIFWRPQPDSNRCYRLERAMSWAWLDDGDY